MKLCNRSSNRVSGILDWIEKGGEYLDVSLTDKATTAAQDTVIDFTKKFGLDKFLPTTTKTVTKPGTKTIAGIDPKVVWLIAGTAAGIIVLILLKRKRKI